MRRSKTMRSKSSSLVTRDAAEAASDFMKRLANPNRLMIACALVGGERSVGELEAELGLKQPLLSQQLAELREAGIVEARREVKQVFYRLSDPRAVALIATLHQTFCGVQLDVSSLTGIAASRSAGPSPNRLWTPSAQPKRSLEAASFGHVG